MASIRYQCQRCQTSKVMYTGGMPPAAGCKMGGNHTWLRASGTSRRFQCQRCGKTKVMYIGARPLSAGCSQGGNHAWIQA